MPTQGGGYTGNQKTWEAPRSESSQYRDLLQATSPFRNGEMQQQGATEIFEVKGDPLIGVVVCKPHDSMPAREFYIALGCEHWAPNGVCRYGKDCEHWVDAVAALENAG